MGPSNEFVPFSANNRDALQHASTIIHDQCLQDLIEVEAHCDRVTDGFLFSCGYLPRAQCGRYNACFLKAFARTIAVMSWKLEQLTIPSISSVAEGLAAHALLREAEHFATEHNLPIDLESVWYVLFAGTSILALFDPESDGATAINGELFTSLTFDSWFSQFHGETAYLSLPIVIEEDMLREEL